jgi:hypothetical protein
MHQSHHGRVRLSTRPVYCFLIGLLFPLLSIAQTASGASGTTVGEVEYARGVGFAQAQGQGPRTLGRGLPLREGDRLNTADGATAIIKMVDGTRMTLRPNSEIVLSQYQYKENASDNNMLLQMLRGGLRTITGLINKNSPNAARIQTNTATVGIRGTDFDARICAQDCAKESDQIQAKARTNAVQASAKIVSAQGNINVVDSTGEKRVLVEGGSVYSGDLIETGRNSQAVLAFRDESRISLGSTTRFKVDNFVYDENNAREGRFLMRLLRGSLRAFTGLIGKANTQNVRYNTATATVGIRGSGGDMHCTGLCAGDPDDGLNFRVFTWNGALVVTPANGNGPPVVLPAGQGITLVNNVVRPINVQPPHEAPRPDQVRIPEKLFGRTEMRENQEGLYLYVRDGHVVVATQNEVLHLGKGEAGFANQQGQTVRPPVIPKFIDFDRTPLPNTPKPFANTILSDSGVKTNKVCQ